ncbi:hypothetical protein AC1031_018857 [Aphanomyces cochlioides]|nr:hypothetical protein AC1031_018857 [Aphanomyces cochlioides]
MMQSISLERSGAYASNSNPRGSFDPFGTGPPSSGGSSNAVSTGKKKTDQVVLEFLYKTVEVVLLSRAYFQPSTPRRARFNLDIQELVHVRDAMRMYKDNVTQPVLVDIFMGATLLERWHISYTSGMQAQSPVDVINQLREVCRRIGILLRAVYCLARILPAFPVGDRLKTQQEDLGHPLVGLQYAIGSVDTDMQVQFDAAEPKQRYSFVPIDTPFGTLQLSVLYRKRNDDLLAAIEQMAVADHSTAAATTATITRELDNVSLKSSTSLENAIIQDYVPTAPVAVKSMPAALPKHPMRVVQEDYSSVHSIASTRSTSQPVSIPPSSVDISGGNGSGGSRVPALRSSSSRYLHEVAPSSPPRRDSNSIFKHAHSYDTSEPLRQPQRPSQVIAAPYGYTNAIPIDTGKMQPTSIALSPSPLHHPNSAPISRPSPRTPQHPVSIGSLPDEPFRPSSVESTRSSTSSSNALPFSVHPKAHSAMKTTSLVGFESPPFRSYSGELVSQSPTTSTPPTRLTFADRRSSLDGGSTWGISPDTPDAFGLVTDEADLILPFAARSHRSNGSSGVAASDVDVSSFLQELKHAPPLQTTSKSDLASVEADLAYFKQLRDQLQA